MNIIQVFSLSLLRVPSGHCCVSFASDQRERIASLNLSFEVIEIFILHKFQVYTQ